MAFADAEIESMAEPELRTLLRAVRTEQRRFAAIVLRIGARADQLATQGRSAPAREMLIGDGEVRGFSARREASRARTTAEVPGLLEAVAHGSIGPDHVDSITRRLQPLSEQQRKQIDEAGMIADAIGLPADTFDASLKRRIQETATRSLLDDAEAKRAASEFRHWFDHGTGMGHFRGRLDPERYEALVHAVDQHTTTLASCRDEPTAKTANLGLEALIELACSAGERRLARPHIVVITDHETLRTGPHRRSVAQTGDGHDLPHDSLARLACDATIRRVTVDGDRPIGTGRRFRTATDAQWDAIRTMYATCAWVGCDRPLSWCQIHHILEWSNHGEGELNNFVPLCSHHHHAVHEGRWSIRLDTDRSLHIWRPDGAHHACTDPPTRRAPPTNLGRAA